MNQQPYVTPGLRLVLLICGTVSLVVGILGLLIPIFPTTPFLLVSAACYFRSSQKFYDWLLSRPYFGRRIRNYREGQGITQRDKIMMIAGYCITLGISTLLFVRSNSVRLILAITAVLVIFIILSMKTNRGTDPGDTAKTRIEKGSIR
jgi:uncharacterized membrane protein YbaN (DUF454 family)